MDLQSCFGSGRGSLTSLYGGSKYVLVGIKIDTFDMISSYVNKVKWLRGGWVERFVSFLSRNKHWEWVGELGEGGCVRFSRRKGTWKMLDMIRMREMGSYLAGIHIYLSVIKSQVGVSGVKESVCPYMCTINSYIRRSHFERSHGEQKKEKLRGEK